MHALAQSFTATWSVAYFLSLVVFVPLILWRRHSPRAANAWLLVVVFLPVIGAVGYLFFGTRGVLPSTLRERERRLARWGRRSGEARWRSAAARRTSSVAIPAISDPATDAPSDEAASESDRTLPSPDCAGRPKRGTPEEEFLAIACLAERLGQARPTDGNRVQLETDADALYAAIVAGINDATESVFVQYFTLRDDDAGGPILDALDAAARRGCEVGLLIDGYGSPALPEERRRGLDLAGVRFARFLPPGWRFWKASPNLRNHRKAVIIDRRVAFIGGFNVGQEHLDGHELCEAWADAHLRIDGPAARDVLEIFVDDWITATGENIAKSPEQKSADAGAEPAAADTPTRTVDDDNDRADTGTQVHNDLHIQVIASGPDDATPLLEDVTFSMLALARRRVLLATPYFAPPPALHTMIRSCALRGLDVTLLTAGASHDSRLAYWCGRWFYEELLEVGVRIFEHDDSFVHAKVLRCDERWTSIGSGNLDERSMRLNFETNVLLRDESIAHEIDEYIGGLLTDANEVTLEQYQQRPLRDRILERAARLMAPSL